MRIVLALCRHHAWLSPVVYITVVVLRPGTVERVGWMEGEKEKEWENLA